MIKLISGLLDFFNPAGLAFKALVVGTVAAGLWFGIVRPYNNFVSTKAVAAALVKERAITAPVIKRLGEWVAVRDAKIDAIETASNAERARQMAAVELKTKELKNALTQNKTFKAELTRLHGDIAGFNSVLDTITANNNRAAGASASARLKQLGAAHVQCEKEYRAERVEHGQTLGELGQALAVVRALKQ